MSSLYLKETVPWIYDLFKVMQLWDEQVQSQVGLYLWLCFDEHKNL